jgi:hypothetical protein
MRKQDAFYNIYLRIRTINTENSILSIVRILSSQHLNGFVRKEIQVGHIKAQTFPDLRNSYVLGDTVEEEFCASPN